MTSATLTEVLNVSGSGVLTFAGITTSTGTTVNPAKFRVVIDGVTALDESTIVLPETSFGAIAGTFQNTQYTFSQEALAFNSSIVVSIAGDSTNGVHFYHRKYLT